MAKGKKKSPDMNAIYSLFSSINTLLLRVSLCLAVSLSERYRFLYNRGSRIVHHSFEITSKSGKE